MSGYVELVPFVQGGWAWLLDPRKPWNDEANSPTWADCKVADTGDVIYYGKRIIRELPVFLCPARPHRDPLASPGPTHYVGVAGVATDSATWSLDHSGTGVFGYDRTVRLSDIKDGISNTMALIETASDNGPWTAGAPSTVRGLDSHGLPYFGRDAQFSSLHQGTNAVFLDATVRNLSSETNPRVFEAFDTVAGGEELE